MLIPRPGATRLLLFLILIVASARGYPSEKKQTYSNIGLGHFAVRSLSPGHVLRPSIAMLPVIDMPQGSFRVRSSFSWGNVWNYDAPHYIVDAEWMHLELELDYAVWDNLTLGVAIVGLGRVGGFADSLIEGFHKAMGFSSAKRERRPRNQVLVQTTDREGRTFRLDDSDWDLGDIPLSLSYRITKGDEIVPATWVVVGGTLPTGDADEITGVGKPLYGGGVLFAKRIGDWPLIVTLGGNFTFGGEDRIAGVKMEEYEAKGLVALEYEVTRDLSLIGQYELSSGVARDFHQFSETVHEIHFGLKWHIAEGVVVELCATENLFYYNNSVDFGLHFGVSKRF